MNEREIADTVAALVAQIYELKARLGAHHSALVYLARLQHIPEEKIEQTLALVTARIHQELLEKAENISPALAAQFDTRSLSEIWELLG
jgi:restriction endonuclease Mrr